MKNSLYKNKPSHGPGSRETHAFGRFTSSSDDINLVQNVATEASIPVVVTIAVQDTLVASPSVISPNAALPPPMDIEYVQASNVAYEAGTAATVGLRPFLVNGQSVTMTTSSGMTANAYLDKSNNLIILYRMVGRLVASMTDWYQPPHSRLLGSA